MIGKGTAAGVHDMEVGGQARGGDHRASCTHSYCAIQITSTSNGGKTVGGEKGLIYAGRGVPLPVTLLRVLVPEGKFG